MKKKCDERALNYAVVVLNENVLSRFRFSFRQQQQKREREKSKYIIKRYLVNDLRKNQIITLTTMYYMFIF